MCFKAKLFALFSLLITAAWATAETHIKEWDGSQYHTHSKSQMLDAHVFLQSLPLSDVSSIIDLGCGSGGSTKVLLDRFPDAHILGVDPNPSMINRARQQWAAHQNIHFLQQDALSFKASRPADLVYSGFVMHWIPKQEQIPALKNIHQNMAPKGTLVLIFSPGKEGLPFQTVLDKLLKKPPYASPFKHFKNNFVTYTLDEYRQMLEQAGFFVEQISYRYNEKTYNSKDELRLWMQQWSPHAQHLAKTSEALRDQFMEELVEQFMVETGQTAKPYQWGEYIMTAVAHKKPGNHDKFPAAPYK